MMPSEQEVNEYLTKAIERRCPGPLQNNPEGIKQLALAAEEAVAEVEEHFDIEFAINQPHTLGAVLRRVKAPNREETENDA